jgi:hypothetical protein
MLIGILSDTHDDMSAISRAVDIFNDENVSHVIHAGDIVSPFTFEAFNNLHCSISAVLGNNDGDKLLLKSRSRGNIQHQPLIMTFNERKIVVVHEPDLVDALSDSGHFQVVIYGHTHVPDIRRRKETLVINPGKAAALHRGESTIALLNLNKMEAKTLKI